MKEQRNQDLLSVVDESARRAGERLAGCEVEILCEGPSRTNAVLGDLAHVAARTVTTAILDRLLHHVAVVHIDGQSYRLPELGALLSPNREVPRGQDGRPNDPR